MTLGNETPTPVATPATETPKNENILLNWIIMIAGMGAIALASKFIPALFTLFK